MTSSILYKIYLKNTSENQIYNDAADKRPTSSQTLNSFIHPRLWYVCRQTLFYMPWDFFSRSSVNGCLGLFFGHAVKT